VHHLRLLALSQARSVHAGHSRSRHLVQALPLLALLSQSVRAVVLVLALLHLRQLRQRGTMTAQLLMLPMLLLLVVFQLLLLVPRRWRRCVPVLLRRLALLLLLLLLLLDCLIQLLLQLLLLLVVQLLVLLARTPSIQLRGRTAGCLLQLLTSTVPSATTPYARAADELAPMKRARQNESISTSTPVGAPAAGDVVAHATSGDAEAGDDYWRGIDVVLSGDSDGEASRGVVVFVSDDVVLSDDSDGCEE
jgi:hypothetical protein